MQNISDSARLLARGTGVTLKDGSTQNLVFDFEAIAALEDQYGSLEGYLAALQNEKGKRFTAIKDAMVATLSHTEMAPKTIVKQLDFKRFQDYVEALTAAFYEAMPEGMAKPGDPLAMPDGNPNGSPGNGSTTPPPSPSAEATKASNG